MRKAIDYNKLVRDKNPELVARDGWLAEYTRVNDPFELRDRLIAKMNEELSEFITDNSLEELADMLEVVRALAEEVYGVRFADLLQRADDKRRDKGGFGGIILKSIYMQEQPKETAAERAVKESEV